MAVTYGFYNSLNGDRKYNAEQMSAIFDGIITDGVFAGIDGKLFTTAGTGMQVLVAPGKAWFNSTWTRNDASLALAVDAADVSLTRIDAVVLEVNSSINVKENAIKMVKGTPSANPAKPAMVSSEDVNQYALAYITIPANLTAITAANIEINVGKSTCPYVTSVLQQTSIDGLFAQWDAEFNTWFSNVQSQLSGDVATNLQKQIDELKMTAYDMATDEDVYNTESQNKTISPHGLRNTIDKIGDIRFTTRSTLGDGWLLANGDSFDSSIYAKLNAYMAERSGNAWNTSTILKPYMKQAGDYVFSWTGDPTYIAYINENTKLIGSVSLPSSYKINSISYANGRYLLKCSRNRGGSVKYEQHMCELFPESGKFVSYNSRGTDCQAEYFLNSANILYINNMYVTGGDDGKYASSSDRYGTIYISSDGLTWTTKNLFTDRSLSSRYSNVSPWCMVSSNDGYVWVLYVIYTDSTSYLSDYYIYRIPESLLASSTPFSASSDGIIEITNLQSNVSDAHYQFTPIIFEYSPNDQSLYYLFYANSSSSGGTYFYKLYRIALPNPSYPYYTDVDISSIISSPLAQVSQAHLSWGWIDGYIHFLTADKKLYKLDTGALTLQKTLDIPDTPSATPAYPFPTFAEFGDTFMYASGANVPINLYNQTPIITPPSGTRAFIKAKECG